MTVITDIDPKTYFNKLKRSRKKNTVEELNKIYDFSISLLDKYISVGQIKGARKIIFQLEVIKKELDLVNNGVDTFVYRDDLEEYIDDVSDKAVKIIELENYERDIPEDIASKIAVLKSKKIFTDYYIVFTDYTGKYERRVEEERKDKDPIIFGAFTDESAGCVCERFYYLGDWEDQYCDLTLDKLLKEAGNISHSVSTPKSLEELKAQLDSLIEENSSNKRDYSVKNIEIEPQNSSILNKIKLFILKLFRIK